MSKEEPIPGLRDFMAVSALSVLSGTDAEVNHSPESVARYCYKIADAMLIERDKPHGVA